MNNIHIIKNYKSEWQAKKIQNGIDRASGVVATSIWDQRHEQDIDSYVVPIGRKPDLIGTVRFETAVANDALRKLAILGIGDVVFNPSETDEASRATAEGYCAQGTDYNRNNLVIVMDRLPPRNVLQLGAMGLQAVQASQVLALAS